MKKQIGFILKYNKYYALLVVPFSFVATKYRKIQIKVKKYYILNYRQEYNKGDIVLFNPSTNKIYMYYK